jgi:hypothetical protein
MRNHLLDRAVKTSRSFPETLADSAARYAHVSLGPFALTLVAASVLLTGCGGSQPPIGAPGAISQASATAAHADSGKSWMLPEAKIGDLLYVSNLGNDTVTVYTYPDGDLVQTISGFGEPLGMCTDAKGNVYITDPGKQQIVEYAHGGAKPIKTLKDRSGYPINCAVDPTTGNLAVTNNDDTGSRYGGVLIYARAEGKGVQYIDRSIFWYFFVAYDTSGDIFVDGQNFFTDKNLVAELPQGHNKFEDLAVNQFIEDAGGLQWDGKYLNVGDQIPEAPRIYLFKISGTSAKLVQTVNIDRNHTFLDVWQFCIYGNTLVAGPNISLEEYFWKYPKGGRPYKRIYKKGLWDPQGVTISPASR